MNRWKKSKNGEYFLVILGDRREERRMKKNEGRKEKRKAKRPMVSDPKRQKGGKEENWKIREK